MSDKRLKRFDKQYSYFKDKNPYYETIRSLYIDDVLKTISSAKKFIEKIKLTKKNELYKYSQKYVELLEKKQKIDNESKLHNNTIDKTFLKIDDAFIQKNIPNEWKPWLHEKLIIDLQNKMTKEKKEAFYVQLVKFYDKNDTLINGIELKTFQLLKGRYRKVFWEEIIIQKLMIGSEGVWKVLDWAKFGGENFNPGNYVTIETIAFKKLDKVIKAGNQIYKRNISNTCVYDGCLNFFKNHGDDRNRKAIYNKLIKQKDTYAKAYTNETLQEIADFTNSRIVIKDLVNGKNFEVLPNTTGKYTIEFLNTRYNHLDRLLNGDTTKKVTFEEYERIKQTSKFYIEKMGKLTTIENTYQVEDDDFKIKFNEWKQKINYSSLLIDDDNDASILIQNYDFSSHCFFNQFEINDDLYDELDIEKAYFNYSNIEKNPQYHGVPSGAFMNLKCEDEFNINTFYESFNNGIIGFYQVIIKKINNRHQLFEKLGIKENDTHIFSSVQIDTFKDDINFKFIQCSISPSINIPFTDDMKAKLGKVSYYSKAVGLFMVTKDEIRTTIKPLECDKNFFSIIQDDNTVMYEYNGLIKIKNINQPFKTGRHISYYIHSYTKNLIFQQLKQVDIDDVFGVKLDSIVIKKNAIIKSILPCFYKDFKVGKIKNLLYNQNYAKQSLFLQKGVNIDYFVEDEDDYKIYGHYKPFYQNTKIDIVFQSSFLPNKEMIKNRVVFMSGKGGAGKSYSILKNNKSVCMVAKCWNLTQKKKEEYTTIRPLTINKITGITNNKTSEKVKVTNDIIFLDEATMLDEKEIHQIIQEYPHKFIFIAGDIDYNGKFYQCVMNNKLIKPCELNCQFVVYKTNYRFDANLNHLLDELRKCDTREKQNEFINIHFKNNIQSIENIVYDDKCVGISDLNDTKHDNELTNYFLKKGATPQYYIKTSYVHLKQYRGAKLDVKPTHSNYECKLFKTIHSFQGLDLKDDEKIIISNKKNFDLNLYYTAFSRARRLEQIILIK